MRAKTTGQEKKSSGVERERPPKLPQRSVSFLVLACALGLSATAAAATQIYSGDLVKMVVDDRARPAVFVKPSTRAGPSDPYVHQYFGENSWDTVVWLNSGGTWTGHGAGYVWNSDITVMNPVSNTTNNLGSGVTEIVTVTSLGSSGVRLTQRFTHKMGERFITKKWTLTNDGSTSFSAARLYHGGDAYFGGQDLATGFYDETKSMIYIRNTLYADWGIMGFYANPATPASRYFEGYFYQGSRLAGSRADLPSTVNPNYVDAGYFLQWDRENLPPGASWTIEAFEIWTPGGALQMVAPGNQNAVPGSTVILPFTVQNLGNSGMSLTLAASTASGWPATVVDGSSVTVPANSSLIANVRVEVPAGASGSSAVTLDASGQASGSASTTLTVVNVNLAISPASIDFGSIAPGGSAEWALTVTNSSGSAVTFGTVAAVAPFGKTADGCSGVTLANGASCAVTATFSASSPSSYNGSLNVPIIDPVLVTRTVSLSGAVNKAVTSVGLFSSANPSSFGQPISFTAEISPGAAGGTVQFQIDGANHGAPVPLFGGRATSMAISTLASGNHSVSALYSGDASHEGSTGTLSGGQTVDRALTRVSVSSLNNPSTFGEQLAFEASVTPALASGIILFFLDGEPIGLPVDVIDGYARSSFVDGPAVGAHSVEAVYSGDERFLGSSGELAGGQRVDRAASGVLVASSANPSTYSSPVSFSATVSPASASGEVQFQIDGMDFGAPVALVGGSATSPAISSLSVGVHAVTALYSGDAIYLASSAGLAGDQIVEKAGSSLSVASSANPSVFSSPVSFTATVSPATASGSVQFQIDGADFGTPISLVDGSATSPAISSLSVGAHAVTALYSGDHSYLASSAGLAGDQLVERAGSTLVVASSANPSVFSNPVSFSATVSPASANGTVQFQIDGADFGAPLSLLDGSATSPAISSLTVGTHVVTVSYSGDESYLASSATLVVDQVVEKAASSLVVSSASNPSTFGDLLTFGAAVSPAGTTGTVQFFVDNQAIGAPAKLVDGFASSPPVASPEVGTHSIEAIYSGDDSYLASSAQLVGGQVVDPAPTSLLIASSPNSSRYGEPVTLTASVTSPSGAVPTGVVDFFAGTRALGSAAVDVAGAASIEEAWLDAGEHALTALFSGDTNHLAAGSEPVAHLVEQASTATTLRSDLEPALYGQALTLAIEVLAQAPGAGVPAGLVELFDGEESLGTSELEDGRTVMVLDDLEIGSHELSARYLGSQSHLPSASAALSQSIAPSCIVGGQVFAAEDPDPENACAYCNPASNATGWSLRLPGFACPQDEHTCTLDVCDGAGSCTHPIAEGCLIEEACVAERERSPANDCLECIPALSLSSYSASARGLVCADDSSEMTDDVCDGAALCVHPLKNRCLIDGQIYAGGAANPENSCQACDPLASFEGWTDRVAGFPCASDERSCTLDACDGAGLCEHTLYAGCLIDSACVPAGALDPENECRDCNPALATGAYSDRARGLACSDDGLANTLDHCDGAAACVHPLKGQCSIDGTVYDAGSANPENPCQSCDPGSNATAWTNRLEGFPCPSDELACTEDVCDGAGSCEHRLFIGCLIDGACVGAGALDPRNDCKACLPSLSTSSHSPRAQGVGCADDGEENTLDVCDGMARCTHPLAGECSIDGQTWRAGSANPDNPCQSCQPASSVTAWTDRVAGYPCSSDGLSCTLDVCDGAGRCEHSLVNGCLINGTCVGERAEAPSNPCTECNPALSTSAWSPMLQGIVCIDDGEENTVDVCDGAGLCVHPLKGECVIGGELFLSGAANPDNPCQSCDPSASVSAWTNLVAGFPCASDGLACTRDVCDGAGACLHTLAESCLIDGACVAAGELSPENDCRACDPRLDAQGYSPRSAGLECSDDGLANTLDVCDGAGVCTHPLTGQCTIGEAIYDSGSPNPDNPCQVCDPRNSESAWTDRVEGFPCPSDGLSCTQDLCAQGGTCEHRLAEGCLISNACIAEGALDPANDCFACQPEESTRGYSLKPVSSACGGACAEDLDCASGYYCTSGVCRHQKSDRMQCESDSECGSGTCQEGECREPELSGGLACSMGGGEVSSVSLALLGLLGLLGRRRRRS